MHFFVLTLKGACIISVFMDSANNGAELVNLARDFATAQHTAFRCYADLVAACRGGYVPTLPVRDGERFGSASELRTLRAALVGDGCRVFPATDDAEIAPDVATLALLALL